MLYLKIAPKRINPSKCVSSLLLPILSPPGLGIYPFPKRANKGPTIIIEPRKELPSFLNSGDSKYPKFISSALKL
ncbi:MAG: Uncharacterised protein [Flavobacterium sp. SCGC AAA160-P02]|nr:MAG: Uncharacterised protein [Flavobacterium sp. SCGC AAA160-P02]